MGHEISLVERDLVDRSVNDVMTRGSEVTKPADDLGSEDKSEVEIISQYRSKAGRRKLQMKHTTSAFQVDLFSSNHHAMARTKVNPIRRPQGSTPNVPFDQRSPGPEPKIRTRTPRQRQVPSGKPDEAETEAIIIDSSPEPKIAAAPKRQNDILKNFIEDDVEIDDDNASYRVMSQVSPSEATELSLREEDLNLSDHSVEGSRAKRRRIQAEQAEIYAQFFPPATEGARHGVDGASDGARGQPGRPLTRDGYDMANPDTDNNVRIPLDSPGPVLLGESARTARIKAEDEDTVEVEVIRPATSRAPALIPVGDVGAASKPPPVRNRPLTQRSDTVKTAPRGASATWLGAPAYDRQRLRRLGQTASPITLPYTQHVLQEGSRAVSNPETLANNYKASNLLVPPVHDSNGHSNGMRPRPGRSPSPVLNATRAGPLVPSFLSPPTPNTAHPRPSEISDPARPRPPLGQRNRKSQLAAAYANRATPAPTRIFEVAASSPAYDSDLLAPQHVQRVAGSTSLHRSHRHQTSTTPPLRFSQPRRGGPAQKRRDNQTATTQTTTPRPRQRLLSQVNVRTNTNADTNTNTESKVNANAPAATSTHQRPLSPHPNPKPDPEPPTNAANTDSANTVLRLSQHIAHLTDRLATIDEERAAQMAEIARLHRGLANATAEIGGLRGEVLRFRGRNGDGGRR